MHTPRAAAGLIVALTLQAWACHGGSSPGGAADGEDAPVLLLDVAVSEPDVPSPFAALCGADADCVEKDAPWCVTPGLCVECRADADCGVWQRCAAGTCLSRVCTPGQAFCAGDVQWTCADGGKSWEAFGCAPGTCQDGACAGCVPGSRWCSEDQVLTCDSKGQAGIEGQVCASATHCVVGQCVQCRISGEKGCVDGRAVECNAFGGWKFGEDCEAAGKACAEGGCIDCDPGTLRCLGQDAQCTYEGETKVLARCLEQGSACWQGECLGLCDTYDFKVPLTENCPGGVCCERPDGTLETTGVNDCGTPASGVYRPSAQCAVPVCCRTAAGADAELARGTCNAAGGVELSAEYCGIPTCCMHPNLRFSVLPLGLCVTAGDVPVADAACEVMGCCRTGPTTFVEADELACAEAGGTVTSALLCRAPQTVTLTADVTPEASSECEYKPWLAVPSSGNDSVVVYNLDTLAVETPAFPVCGNPSRMLMDADTNIVVACRADGAIVKATKDGLILWTRPGCGPSGSRGVALGPGGRLFAACDATVLELNPLTGDTVDSIHAGSWIYGIAADATGIYVAAGGIVKVGIDKPSFYVAWTVSHGYYGIATDGLGTVWLSGGAISALDGDDGSELESYPLPAGVTSSAGLAVGPDGLVYVAAYGAGVYVVAPGVGVIRHLVPPAAALSTKGVALDAKGNLYAIHLGSSNITRFDPQGGATLFGGGGLTYPYAYNGDMTGLGAGCIASGSSTTWQSGPVAGPSETTAWLDVTWQATSPPGAAIYVAWRPGPTKPWKSIEQGAVLAHVGPSVEFLVHLAGTETAKPHLESITVRYVQP
jgi:hypothetical protein